MVDEDKKFKVVEAKWQKWWEEHPELYRAEDNGKKPKKYVLVEFPYPSGSGLHVGHAFSFTGADVYARFQRMKGFNTLFPMGWDAFGLPTENYAIKMKRKPSEVTKENTDMFRSQMKRLAYSFDWSREVNTTDPDYYKWTQWIFIQLFKKGLAYKQEMPINWCPSCKVGLANEEVVNGKCERCGTEVERRTISQWVVKITDYADRLIDGLKNTDFIEKVKQAQINWIGKSEGARVKFKIENSDKELEVFTTRPDTLYGATFMVVAPEHPLVMDVIDSSPDLDFGTKRKENLPFAKGRYGEKEYKFDLEAIKNYVKSTRGKSDMERTELNKDKTGVFLGLYAINPVNGKEIPIWISDFVLASYGTGAIMSVPGHDQRDWDFAKKFGLPIFPVIWPVDIKAYMDSRDQTAAEEDFSMMVRSEKPYTEATGELGASGEWNGLKVPEEFNKVLDWIEKKEIGKRAASYHLRDWIFSRQHYWGEPIPMVYCEEHKWVPVSESDLPIRLPDVEAYEPTDDGKSPLSKIAEFVNTVCPVCGKPAKRETDTMPNWAGSDWYFMRYCDPVNDIVLSSQELLKKWMPVDIYIGGDEHNTLHLLYSRFIYQFLWDLGVVPKEIPEPYFKRISHGVILGPDNQRMSKSRGNVVVPETAADQYGVDVIRMYLMFMGPFDGVMAWNEKTLMGVKRFLERFEKSVVSWQLQVTNESSKEVKVIINKTIDGVTRDLEEFGYNTAIAKMMEALNKLTINSYQLSVEDIKTLIKLMAPLAPYMAEELWHQVGGGESSVHVAEWPRADKKYLVEDKIMVAVAINGKVRDEIEIDSAKQNDKDEILRMAKETEKVKKWVGDKKIIKEIYVPGKMVNLVVEQ